MQRHVINCIDSYFKMDVFESCFNFTKAGLQTSNTIGGNPHQQHKNNNKPHKHAGNIKITKQSEALWY